MKIHDITDYQLAIFDPAQTAGFFQFNSGSVTPTVTTPVKLVVSDPRRIKLTIFVAINQPAGTYGYAPGTGKDTGNFRQIPQAEGIEIKYADDGAIVGMDWYIVGNIPGVKICYWEVLFNVTTAKARRGNVSRSNGNVRVPTINPKKRW